MRFSQEWLETLRSNIAIEDVVSEFVPLKQKGRRLWGCCPFHSEKTPSFSVDPESQMYYCFGCHRGGTVFQFVMEAERMEFYDAVETLAERAHMPLPDRIVSVEAENAEKALRERLFEANRAAAMYYHRCLWTDEGAKALTYLRARGLNDADIKRFGLGVSLDRSDGLKETLLRAGFTEEELVRAWLLGRKEGRTYDMFRNRVMFPIISAQGRVLGFGGRTMGDGQPKYMNTADTPVFGKRNGLYALNFVRKERSMGHLVLVEGYMDAVSLRKHEIPGVVATLGTALTESQARLMKRYAPEVWISYDGDDAGHKAALRALDILEAQSIRVRVIDYPSGMDPDDFIRQKGRDAWAALPKREAEEYRLLRAKDDVDMTTQEGKTHYAIEACGILKRMANPVEMENYVQRIMQETDFPRDVLLRQIGVSPSAEAREPRAPLKATVAHELLDYEKAERLLTALLYRGLIPDAMVHPEDFDSVTLRELCEWIRAEKAAAAYVDTLEGDRRDEAAAALHYDPLPETREVAIDEAESCINCIHTHKIEQRIQWLQEKLVGADEHDRRRISEQIQTLLREL